MEGCLDYYPRFTHKGHSKAQRLASTEASAEPLSPAVCDVAVQAVRDEETARDIILANLVKVIFQEFTQITSERRRLISKLSIGIPQALASKILGVSQKMIQRGNVDLIADATHQFGQAQPKQKLQKWTLFATSLQIIYWTLFRLCGVVVIGVLCAAQKSIFTRNTPNFFNSAFQNRFLSAGRILSNAFWTKKPQISPP